MKGRIDWPAHVVLILGAALFLLPLWLVVAGSTLDPAAIARGELSLIPRLSAERGANAE